MQGIDTATAFECGLHPGECALFDVNIVHDSSAFELLHRRPPPPPPLPPPPATPTLI